MTSSRRNALILIALAVAGAYAFHRGADNFWGVVTCGLVIVWALFSMLPWMDATWRLKVGFVAVTFVSAFIVLWPTLENVTDGKLKCPWYVKSHITFGIAPGLDLRGGLRLVYTVEVEEAIRDKRDRFADEMRQELATIYEIHSGEGLVTRDELAKLEEKVHVSTPESAIVRVKFKDAADITKLDERYQKKFATELMQSRGPGANVITFKIRTEVETADPRPRGQPGEGHRQPARRRARPARGERHDARRGHHRRGAGRGPKSVRRDQGHHPPHRPPRVQDGRRRGQRDFFGATKKPTTAKRATRTASPRTKASRSTKPTRPTVRARA